MGTLASLTTLRAPVLPGRDSREGCRELARDPARDPEFAAVTATFSEGSCSWSCPDCKAISWAHCPVARACPEAREDIATPEPLRMKAWPFGFCQLVPAPDCPTLESAFAAPV